MLDLQSSVGRSCVGDRECPVCRAIEDYPDSHPVDLYELIRVLDEKLDLIERNYRTLVEAWVESSTDATSVTKN